MNNELGSDKMQEGDFVMGKTSAGIIHGRIEHIMWEGGVLGTPSSEYALESMPPDNPAMSVRIYVQEEGAWEETAFSIGMMYKDAEKLDSLEDHMMDKADTYKPTTGMQTAAKRAIRWKEEGKATGAGTAVGWTRARQLANREPLTLDTVKRMYSFFSRHEVDKKGKDFYNTSNPSNGRIMWDAWGGDGGFSWSRRIVNSAKKNSSEKADGVKVGSMVSWNSSGGRAEGKVVRIVRDGSIDVPDSEFTITGTPEDPAALIRLYRDGKPTDTYVGHKLSTLRTLSSKAEGMDDEDEYPEDDYAHLSDEELEKDIMEKRDYNERARRRMAASGQAMPDGSFPIANRADLQNAIQSVGRAKDYEAAKRHIIARARALGLTEMLPEDWKKGMSKMWNGTFLG